METKKIEKTVKINNIDFDLKNLREKILNGLQTLEKGGLVIKKTNYFKIEFPKETICIFKKTQKVKFVKSENDITKVYEIDTLNEIRNLLESYKFNCPFIIEEGKAIYLFDSNIMRVLNKPIIYEIKNGNAIIKTIENKETKYGIGDKFKPLELSKFFYEFFKFNDQDKNEDFIYYSEERDIGRLKLHEFLEQFEDSSLNFFKFTGPSSNGKTTTLLKFARRNLNIMYFNLRFLHEKENDIPILYEYFTMELKSLFLNDTIINELNNYLRNFINENYMQILMGIISILKDYKIIVIFDQFKKRNKLYYILNSFFDELKTRKYKIKFILCSSINDDEIKEEVIKTIENFKGIPTILNTMNQYYFFYFNSLFEPRINQADLYNPINELFNYLPKYKSQFQKIKDKEKMKDELKVINSQIIGKILEKNNNINLGNLSGIFIIILNKINDKFEYTPENYTILRRYIPLKYFILIFNENYFEIKYAFPYVKHFLISQISISEADNFFLNNKYLFFQYLESYAKSYYYEFAAKFRFKNLLQDFGPIKEIKVNNITEMSEIIEDSVENAILKIFNKVPTIKFNIINDNSQIQIHNKEEKIFEIKKDYIENMINNTLKNINYYKSIQNTKICNLKKKYDYSTNNLLIDQEFLRGQHLDQSFIYGDKDNRIFVGIQIKCYTNKTTNLSSDLNFLDKGKIKKNICNILQCTKNLLNININQWKYLLVIYFNEKDSEGPFCEELVKKCIQKNIAYIFYDPYNKIFLDPKKNILYTIDFSDIIFNLDSENKNEYVEKWFGDINYISKKNLLNKKRKKKITDYEEIKTSFNLLIEKLKKSGEYKLQNDYEIYNSFKNDIINIVQIDSNKEEIILTSYFDGKDIEAPFPDSNYLFLCNKKVTEELLLSVNYNNTAYVLDFKNLKKIYEINKGLSLIDKEKTIIVMKIRNKEL